MIRNSPACLFQCTGHLNKLINETKRWQNLSGAEPIVLEIHRPNVLFFRDVDIPPLKFTQNGKIQAQNQSTFILIPDSLSPTDVYGLTLSDISNSKQFKETLEHLIGGLSVRPREQIGQPRERGRNFSSGGSSNFSSQGSHYESVAINEKENFPPDQRPAVQHQNFMSPSAKDSQKGFIANQPDEKEIALDLLTEAIHNGNLAEARKQAEILAKAKSRLTIHFLADDTDSDDGDGENVEISVSVFDQQDMNGATVLPLTIKSLSKTTIGQLKKQFAEEKKIPVHSQKWVINKRLAEDKDTLYFCGLTSPEKEASIYMYITTVVQNQQDEPIYEAIQNQHPQQGWNQSPQHQQQRGPFQQGMPPRQPWPGSSQEMDDLGRQFQSMAVGGAMRSPARPGMSFDNWNRSAFEFRGQPVPDARMQFIPENFQREGFHPAGPPQLPQRRKVENRVADVGWICTACTFKNRPTYPSCEQCLTARPENYQVPENYIPTLEEQRRLEEEKLNEKLVLEAEFKFKEEELMRANENYLQTLAFAQKKLLPNNEDFDCGICYTNIDKGEGVMLRECLHLFCKECLVQTINASEDPEVHCPENSAYPCPAVITDQEINELLNEEDYGKFLERGLAQAEMATKNSFHCKSINCKGWCIYEDDVNDFPCPLCEKTNCLTCKAIHENQTCKQYQEDLKIRAQNDEAARKTQEMLNELVRRGDAMNCPQCQVILQKKSGCDWMRCTMCKTEICWATKGPRWGPGGKGDTSAGCKCGVNGVRCTPTCGNCH